YDKQGKLEARILDSFNYFFTAVFTVEFILRLSAFSFRHYFSDIWNVIDFVLVLGSYIDIIVTQSDISQVKFSVNFFRLFRVMRLIKLLSKEESIRQLLWTFIKSIQVIFLTLHRIYSLMVCFNNSIHVIILLIIYNNMISTSFYVCIGEQT
ncbi:unnamed protein product, partial [Schistosoma margrebowiei]